MRPLQITLALIALVILTTQTFRHAYVRWLEPRTSVLDRCAEKVEQDITAAKSLDALVSLYEEAHRKVKEAEKEDAKVPKADREELYERLAREPYKSEATVKGAIQTWEQHGKEIYELRFFWTCGLVSILSGIGCYKYFSRWIGIAGIAAGFSEMIYWTAPSFRVFGSEVEFDRLLTQKLIFSVVSWILLLGLWFVSNRKEIDP